MDAMGGIEKIWEHNKVLILWEATAIFMSLETHSFGPLIIFTLVAVFVKLFIE